jgi:hypothetical protein
VHRDEERPRLALVRTRPRRRLFDEGFESGFELDPLLWREAEREPAGFARLDR